MSQQWGAARGTGSRSRAGAGHGPAYHSAQRPFCVLEAAGWCSPRMHGPCRSKGRKQSQVAPTQRRVTPIKGHEQLGFAGWPCVRNGLCVWGCPCPSRGRDTSTRSWHSSCAQGTEGCACRGGLSLPTPPQPLSPNPKWTLFPLFPPRGGKQEDPRMQSEGHRGVPTLVRVGCLSVSTVAPQNLGTGGTGACRSRLTSCVPCTNPPSGMRGWAVSLRPRGQPPMCQEGSCSTCDP